MAAAPAIKRTWFLALLLLAYRKITGEKSEHGSAAAADGEDIDVNDADDASGTSSDAPGSGTATPKEGAGANGSNGALKGGRVATSMAGGRRRKTVRKK